MSALSYEFLKAELSGDQRARVDSYLNSPLYYLITGRSFIRGIIRRWLCARIRILRTGCWCFRRWGNVIMN